jgi:hypothetical protein
MWHAKKVKGGEWGMRWGTDTLGTLSEEMAEVAPARAGRGEGKLRARKVTMTGETEKLAQDACKRIVSAMWHVRVRSQLARLGQTKLRRPNRGSRGA